MIPNIILQGCHDSQIIEREILDDHLILFPICSGFFPQNTTEVAEIQNLVPQTSGSWMEETFEIMSL